MKKVLFVSVILTSLLMGCMKADNNENEPTIHEPGGYKPIIYYHGKLYGIYDFAEELPVGFIDSGDKIIASEKDEYTLPNKECYTTSFNSHNVGGTIYVNSDDEDTIYIEAVLKDNQFIIFKYDENEE